MESLLNAVASAFGCMGAIAFLAFAVAVGIWIVRDNNRVNEKVAEEIREELKRQMREKYGINRDDE